MKNQRKRKTKAVRHRERGVALIVVLGTLVVIGLMASHVATVSEVVARQAQINALRGELKYAAESAAERAYWLLLADRVLFSNRTLGANIGGRELQEEEGWMMDGAVHNLKVMNHDVNVVLRDADSGFDVSGSNPAEQLRRTLIVNDDPERQLEVDKFLDILADYVDPDDSLHLHGKEQDDYTAEGLWMLPRNAPLQFRAELYWLENVADAFSRSIVQTRLDPSAGEFVRLIPPDNLSFSARRRGGASERPSFFSSSAELIRRLSGLTDADIELVLEARRRWNSDSLAIHEFLPPEIMANLRSKFSFNESGVVTILATAYAADGEIQRTIRITRDCRPGRNAFADPQSDYFALWEKICF